LIENIWKIGFLVIKKIEFEDQGMYDGLKIWIRDPAYADKLIKNPLLRFIDNHDISGEVLTTEDKKLHKVKTYIYATFKGMRFYIFETKSVHILGSLHVYYNEGEENCNRFTLSDFVNSRIRFCQEFELDANIARIHNIEIGLNVIVPFVPTVLIRNLVSFNNKAFMAMEGNNHFGRQTLKFGAQYSLKVYHKMNKVLRIELKFKKMEALLKRPISLMDLESVELIERCEKLLLGIEAKLIIREELDYSLMNGDQKNIYDKFTNPLRMNDFRNRSHKSREKREFERIRREYCVSNLKEILFENFKDELVLVKSIPNKNLSVHNLL
jgi:hypothetical protein